MQLGNWIWDTTNEKWVKLAGTAAGAMSIHAIVDELNDITDVDVAAPTDLYIVYWNNTNSKWECRAFTAWLHASAHQNGGDDEISVTGLSGLLADDQHVLDAEVISAVGTVSITFIIDGGGVAITTGEKGHLEIPFGCTINQVTMMADQSGSIVVDIWKDTYANFPPADGDSITASAPPTLSTAQKNQDTTLTGWTTAIAAGDILAFNVDSCTTITRVTISLKVTKT